MHALYRRSAGAGRTLAFLDRRFEMLLPTFLAVLTLLVALIGLIVHLKRRAQGRTEPR
jgi:hypothetical protein